MVISVEKNPINLQCAKNGDLLLTDKNLLILIISDFDGQDFRGVNLFTNECTTCYKRIEDLVESITIYYNYGKIIELIPSNKIEVIRRN